MPTEAHDKYCEQSDGWAYSPVVTQFVSVLLPPALLGGLVGDVVSTTAGAVPTLLAPLLLHADVDEIRPTAALNAFSNGHLHELQIPS